ncbi:MAG TPA: heavy-metal-associated domain-containing protein [Syntrophomonadaceae bacterium]|nr:heavy-metal-associated domain-containing protein [Syntrophomonadaceae bacterium]
MTTKTYQLQTLTCPTCVKKIEKAVKSMDGVKGVDVLFNASRVKVNFDDSLGDGTDIKKVIERLGFGILGEK